LGDVYIADFSQPGGVAEYAPGRMNALRSLAAGDLGVISVALDPDGNLYAADQFDNRVFVYAPGKTQPFRVYTTLNPAFVTISP
jgi:DNA-binding beta-propeller fold protein YncE